MSDKKEQRRKYMSEYMSQRYANDINASRAKSRENYHKYKYSVSNQTKKINKHIVNLRADIMLMVDNNEDFSNEISIIKNHLSTLVKILDTFELEQTTPDDKQETPKEEAIPQTTLATYATYQQQNARPLRVVY